MPKRFLRNLFVLLFLLVSVSSFAAVDFDGTDDLLDCGTNDILTENGAVTVSAWTNRTTGYGSAANIIAKFVDTTAGFQFRVLANEKVDFFIQGSTEDFIQRTDILYTEGAWQHLLVTWDGSTTAANAHIYIDGTEATYSTTTDGVGPGDNSAGTVIIGMQSGTTQAWLGQITEIAVWDTELSASEITLLASSKVKRLPLQVSPANLVAYWPLDELADGGNLAGATFNDLVGTNTCTGDDTDASGGQGKAEEVLSYP